MGEAFGLYVALPAGGELVELPVWLSTNTTEFIVSDKVSTYPNPATNVLNIQYSLIEDAEVSVGVYDLLGSKVMEEKLSAQSNQLQNTRMDVSTLDSGLYFVTISAGESKVTKKVQVVN
ncbi:MAG: T9SS type A sorting domain-containing protein [Bacteroidales bacterium]